MNRILKTGNFRITQGYSWRHKAVDLVKAPSQLDYIKAHTRGKVVFCQTGLTNAKGSTGNKSYGNCVKIDHGNGWATLYAHLDKVFVKLGDIVDTGKDIGFMGNTGNSYGAHLHFEVWRNGQRIDPTKYLDKDLPIIEEPDFANTLYRVQVGAFSVKANAKRMVDALKKDGFDGYIITTKTGLMRVQVGAFKNKINAENFSKKLSDLGYNNFIVTSGNSSEDPKKELQEGDKIKVIGNYYTNGKVIPKWVKASILYVRKIEKGGKVLLVSTEKVKKVYTGRIFAVDAKEI